MTQYSNNQILIFAVLLAYAIPFPLNCFLSWFAVKVKATSYENALLCWAFGFVPILNIAIACSLIKEIYQHYKKKLANSIKTKGKTKSDKRS